MRCLRTGIASLIAFAACAAPAAATTFTVNTTGDTVDASGCSTPQSTCSLRDAVIAANQVNGATTITLGSGDYKLTISGQNQGAFAGDLNYAGGPGAATNSLTINGNGPANTTIDGNGLDRIFHVMCPMSYPCPTAGTSLTVNGVTLTGGLAGPDLVDPNSVNSNPANTARAGAILFDTGGTLTITNSAFTNNQAVATGGSVHYAEGGAIEAGNGATVDITGSTFSDDKALGDGVMGGGEGGAIYGDSGVGLVQTGATVSITNSTLTGNQAGGGGGHNWGEGGAVDSYGMNTTVAGSTFTNNLSGGGGGSAYGDAGALYAENQLTLTGSTFTGNTSGGGGGGAYADGGAVYDDFGPASISSSTFTGNKAGGGGGGAYADGGAIYSDFGPTTIAGDTIDGNSAGGGGTGTGSGAYAAGGGLDSEGFGNLTVTNSTISDNTAGGGDTNSYGQGGGIYADNFSGATNLIVGSTISGNSVSGGDAGSEPEGGGIYAVAVTVTDSTIANNTAGSASGGSGDGGGIDSVVTLNSSTVSGNRVVVGLGTAGGGGIDGDLTIHNSIISGNVLGTTTANNCSGGAVTSQGHNIENGTTCVLSKPGDLNADPRLAPLASNGGTVQTMALLPGSPAINAGDNSGCPATDERGVSRPQPVGGTCDIGAFEYAPATTSAVLNWSCTAPGHVTITITAGQGAPPPAAVHYTLDGGAEQRVTVTGNPATITLAVPAGPHVMTYWGEGKDGDLAAQHTASLHCVLPVITKLKINPVKFRPAASGAPILVHVHKGVCGKPKGSEHPVRCATVSYDDTLSAVTTFHVERLVGKHYVQLPASFTHQDKVGKNTFVFSGRLGGQALPVGSYKLVAGPGGAVAKFRIVS